MLQWLISSGQPLLSGDYCSDLYRVSSIQDVRRRGFGVGDVRAG